jgi:SAM-dependent methyltransferase
MNNTDQVRLNIGAGGTYIPGFTNIDISTKADITLDLGKNRLPFNDDSVDLVFSYHTLEHVPDYLFAISEIHRVLKHGGRFLVGLPYVTLSEYNLVNPYHYQNFNEFSFDFFVPNKLKGSAAETNPVLFKKVFHRFYYIGAFHIIPPPLRSWCRRHLFNVVRKIDYGLIAVKRKDEEVPFYDKKKLQREFQACLHSRVPYRKSKAVQSQRNFTRLLKRVHSWWMGYG